MSFFPILRNSILVSPFCLLAPNFLAFPRFVVSYFFFFPHLRLSPLTWLHFDSIGIASCHSSRPTSPYFTFCPFFSVSRPGVVLYWPVASCPASHLVSSCQIAGFITLFLTSVCLMWSSSPFSSHSSPLFALLRCVAPLHIPPLTFLILWVVVLHDPLRPSYHVLGTDSSVHSSYLASHYSQLSWKVSSVFVLGPLLYLCEGAFSICGLHHFPVCFVLSILLSFSFGSQLITSRWFRLYCISFLASHLAPLPSFALPTLLLWHLTTH